MTDTIDLVRLFESVGNDLGWAEFNYTQATYKPGSLDAGLTCILNAVHTLRRAGATDNKAGYRFKGTDHTKGELVMFARIYRALLQEVEDELSRRKPGPDERDSDPDAYLGTPEERARIWQPEL